jgi:hypothetical protein
MKTLAGFAALALALGVAAPAFADDYGNYGAHDTYGPSYGYDKSHNSNRRVSLMTRAELLREVEEQGYYDVGDLHPSSFGGDWQATAHIDGELVSITIDPYSGRVLTAQEI